MVDIASVSRRGYIKDGKTWDDVSITRRDGELLGTVPVQISQGQCSHDEALEAAGYHQYKWDFELQDSPTIPIDKLFYNGHNAPLQQVNDLNDFFPSGNSGASRYRHTYEPGHHLDALLVNKKSDVLIVYLHGATFRKRTRLPRFERLATLSQEDVSSMYFSDPTMYRHERVMLGWYTGWKGVDVQQHIADWAMIAAQEIGAKHIVVAGASGGGFAALQVSGLIPDSICLTFNPSTKIHEYYTNGDPGIRGAQRDYIRYVHPEVVVGKIDSMDLDPDWTTNLGDEVSAIRRYGKPVSNWVLFVNNINDWHIEQHFDPFMESARQGGNTNRIQVLEYEMGHGHFPPKNPEFMGALAAAIEWSRSSNKAQWVAPTQWVREM